MKTCLWIAGLLLATAAQAQKLQGALQFEKGSRLEMVTQANSVMSQGMADTKVSVTLWRVFDVNDVQAGNAVIEHKVKRVQFQMENDMMGSQSFDSEKESDMKEQFGKAMEKTLKNKYTMTVDPSGKVVSVRHETDEKKKNTTEGDMMAGMMNQLAQGLDVPKMGDRTDFYLLPARELAKGDSWTDSIGGRKTSYQLTDLTDADALISFSEDEQVNRTQVMMGREIQVKSTDHSTGRITLDRKTGLLKEKTVETASSGEMQMMGQTMPFTRTIKKKVTVKATPSAGQ